MHIHIHTYIYVHIHTHIYMHIHIHIPIHTHIHIHFLIHMHIYMHINIHTKYINEYTYMFTYKYVFTCTYILKCTNSFHIHIHIHVRIGGNSEAMRRRRNILKKKVRALIFHMLGIFTVMVFLPLSVIIFGSVNSSTQMLIHERTNNTLGTIVLMVVCVATHTHTSTCAARDKLNY